MQICNFFMFFDITLKIFHILLSIFNYLKKMAFQIKHYAPTSLITSNLNANVFYEFFFEQFEHIFEAIRQVFESILTTIKKSKCALFSIKIVYGKIYFYSEKPNRSL